MLEVRELTKIYKTKNGVDVKALDDVSLQFPQKGMVFLLGKSGSGKSTLLNVCGGLDEPTFGEILIKGKSSKAFSQSDFDSYRNTHVGFIFQEYNILNEFSVEDNIALALELQGKPKDKKAIEALLQEVDLAGYAKRKPNTLSGGQKQRIAIARALVKSPDIIMADEPTGALDSATGKQVFETLKKLSKDKLVIVVSHDREFAELYGDRIIELQDGRILSDVTKTHEKQKEISANMHSVGDVLCIKQGTELTETDFEKIKMFLQRANGNVIIAGNEKDVTTFKKANRITEDGEKEVFLDTREDTLEKKTYDPKDSKFIRSKLPAKHAIRIGLSSLKSKPVRLFFTILLCTVSFVLFGLLSTINFYDSEATFKQTLFDSEHPILRLEKNYQARVISHRNGVVDHEYDTLYAANFSEAEINELQSQFGSDVFGGVLVNTNYNVRSVVAPYWMNQITTIAFLPEKNSLRGKISGNYPAATDEICISSYMADVIINCRTYDENGDVIDVSNREELLGQKMLLDGTTYKIVGILDSGILPDKFESLKSAEEDNNRLLSELLIQLQDGLHFVAFVSYDGIEKVAQEYKPYAGDDLSWYHYISTVAKNTEGQYDFPSWSNAVYDQLSSISASQKIIYTDGEKTSLADNEAIINSYTLSELIREQYYEKADIAAANEDWMLLEKLNATANICHQIVSGGIWQEDGDLLPFTEEELNQKVVQLLNNANKDGISLTFGAKLFDHDTQATYGDLREFNIVGVTLYKENDSYVNKIYVSDAVAEQWWAEQQLNVDYYSITTTAYQEPANAVYNDIFLPYDKSEAQTENFWNIYRNEKYDENASRIKPSSLFVDRLEMIDSLIKDLSKVFLYVGLVLAIFSALLLSNFISVSISQKKKEIGILRAVGARSLDVFKIFFSESFNIAVICIVLATIGSVVVCNILNTQVTSDLGASLFVFGTSSFAVLILIAIVTTIVATFLPVWNAAKKKPVDSIRAL